MLARGHRIRIGAGMVGWSITNAQPRIASEIEGDSVRLATPELPQTRSEAAFPLRARGQVIGALTIQSAVSAAFGETEISTFQTLADQIAIALENARLFAESRQDLQKAQLTAREITSKAWNAYLKGGADLDFRYDKGQITAAAADQEDQSSRLSLPIPLRDQFLGKIHFHKGDSKPWAEEEVAMLSSIVEQIGIALDSARLYQETRRRAERERLTGEITARFRQTNNSQEILQTAVVELCRALQADRARLYLNTPEAEIKIASDDLQNNG